LSEGLYQCRWELVDEKLLFETGSMWGDAHNNTNHAASTHNMQPARPYLRLWIWLSLCGGLMKACIMALLQDGRQSAL